MAQVLGRVSVVERIAAAVDRARVAGGGTVVVCGPGGVGTSSVVEEALRPFGTKVSRARGGVPPDADAAVWWIDDAQRMPPADAERLGSATVAPSRVLLLSGRAPLGASLAALVRDAVRADPSRVVDVAPLGPQDALAVVAGLSGHGWREGDEAARALQLAAASGSRVSLLAAVLDAGGSVGGTAVRAAVDDLLSDLTRAARRLLDVVAVGRSAARAAALEDVWARDADEDASNAGFDVALAELLDAGLVVASGDGLRMSVPIVGEALAAQLGTCRAAALHVGFAETLARLEGVDPRESADHVRVVADRLPRALSVRVLVTSAGRRIAAFDPLGAATDLEVAASLLEVAADGGSVADSAAAFDVLLALGSAYYHGGRIEQADAAYRRAERFQDAVQAAKLAEFGLYKTVCFSTAPRALLMRIHLITAESPESRRLRRGRLIQFPQLTMPLIAALTPREHEVSPHGRDRRARRLDRPADLVGITAPDAVRSSRLQPRPGVPPPRRAGRDRRTARDRAPRGGRAPRRRRRRRRGRGHVAARARRRRRRDSSSRVYVSTRQAPLAGMPAPRWDLIKGRRYGKSVTIATRGCPHRCDYCSIPLLYGPGTMRYRPVDEVVREVAASPTRAVVFWDDNIGANPRYAKELFRRSPRSGSGGQASARRTARSDEEFRDWRPRSGCKALFLGLESISQESLEATNKAPQPRRRLPRGSSRILHRHGIAVAPRDHVRVRPGRPGDLPPHGRVPRRGRRRRRDGEHGRADAGHADVPALAGRGPDPDHRLVEVRRQETLCLRARPHVARRS